MEIVRLLVDNGADVNPETGYPPLTYAVARGNIDMVRILMDHGAKYDVKDKDGWTAFRRAAEASNREIIELFISEGADVSGIHRAACIGDLSRVKSLLGQGADVDEQDELGWTPLYWAVSMGQEEVGEFLLSQGAQPDAKSEGGQTVLQKAVSAGALRLAELLILEGADVNAKDENGRTPLHNTASAGTLRLAELLILEGADVNAKDEQGIMPLHNAALGGHSQVAELLIAKGADVNAIVQGLTPLSLAVMRGQKDMVEVLLANGADANIEGPQERGLLDIAKQIGDTEIVEILTEALDQQNAEPELGEEE